MLWTLATLLALNTALAKPPAEYAEFIEHAESLPADKHAIPAPLVEAEPMPWAVGQWALYEFTDKKGRVAYEKRMVVAKDECGWWVESVSQDDKHRTVSKICFTDMPEVETDLEKTTKGAMDLVQVMITQTDGKKASVLDFRTPEGQMMRQMSGALLADAIEQWDWSASQPTEDVTVEGGSFSGAIKSDFDFRVAMVRVSGTSWVHPAVPVNGLVKLVTDKGETTELVDFGMEGAESLLVE